MYLLIFGILIIALGSVVAWRVNKEKIKNSWVYRLIVLFLTKIN